MLRRRLAICLPCCVALASPTRVVAAPAPSEASVESAPVDDTAPPVDDADPPPSDEGASDPEGDDAGDAAAADEPRAPAPAVFAPTNPPPPATAEHVPEPALAPGVPGGYWDLDKTRGREPPDGDDEVLAGSIILPLGILSAGSSVATVWLSTPGHCESRWKSLGASPDRDQCKGLYAFGWVRLTYGSLMVITGAALLGVGLHRRNKHAQWERGHARRPQIVPWVGRGGAGVSLTLRLGARRAR